MMILFQPTFPELLQVKRLGIAGAQYFKSQMHFLLPNQLHQSSEWTV